ncbi:bleomycin resistance protein [Microbacterium testaceum]|uniref:bleomycin resistance protein n=1 Tax=Microbacterium testaceum TaxID=2033 RepID=UPI00380B7D11
MADFAAPNLPSRDFAATAAFYAGFGFEAVHRDEGWLILRRGGVQLEFYPHPEIVPTENLSMCCIRVDDLDGLIGEIAASGVPEATVGAPRLHAAHLQPWGLRAGFLIDPDGTQLTLIGNHG